MNLSALIAGAFGVMGFVLSVFAGIAANNPMEVILSRSILWAIACYVIGYLVGMMAGQVASEHAAKLARTVADTDAAAESARAAKAAEDAENAAAQNVARASAVPAK